jgi:hypothetical protein
MDSFKVWGVVCLLVGFGFLVSALQIYLRRIRFLAQAKPVTGTVVEVQVRGIGRNAVVYPVFEFYTAEGALQRTESLMGSGFTSFEVGQAIKIRYDPANPGAAEVDSFAVLWGLVLLRAGFAFLFLLLGFIGLIV